MACPGSGRGDAVKITSTAKHFLVVSLEDRAAAAELAARKARAAYQSGPMRLAAERLADAHDEAAAAYRKALREAEEVTCG